jgi:hypothetical protein
MFVAMPLMAPAPPGGTTIYVDDDNCPGPGNGTEGDPYCSIQTAIDNAAYGNEILVAPGTYFETINLLGKAIWLHSSDGPEVTSIAANGPIEANTAVTCNSGEGPDTVLGGFTITGGTGTLIEILPDVFIEVGGGMLNDDSSPTVTECTFSGNTAASGGGMYNNGASPTVTNCTFRGNSATSGGGGMFNWSNSSPTLTTCAFIANSAGDWAGGMYSRASSPALTSCTFLANSAANEGGGMYIDLSSSTLTNCIFSGNSADTGGAMYVWYLSSPTVTNCTFTANRAALNGAAMAVASGDDQEPSTVAMTNCILWDGEDEIWNKDGSSIEIAYSDVQGGFSGTGIINADPMFVHNPDPGPDGEWGTEDDDYGDLRLQPGSPCIDAGNNWGVPLDEYDFDENGVLCELLPFDVDGSPRFNADELDFDPGCGIPVVVDIGAYEYQYDPMDRVIFADLNADRAVSTTDLLSLLSAWGPCNDEGCCLADLDIDDSVGTSDLLKLLANWGPCP